MGARAPEAADPGNRNQLWARSGASQAPLKGPRQPLAPPGAPFPHARDGKREAGVSRAFKEWGRRSVGFLGPHPEEPRVARRLEGWPHDSASWFETHRFAVLLTMRRNAGQVRQ